MNCGAERPARRRAYRAIRERGSQPGLPPHRRVTPSHEDDRSRRCSAPSQGIGLASKAQASPPVCDQGTERTRVPLRPKVRRLRVPFRKRPAAPDDALAATGLLGQTTLNGFKTRVAWIRPAPAGLASASSGSRRAFLKGTLTSWRGKRAAPPSGRAERRSSSTPRRPSGESRCCETSSRRDASTRPGRKHR